INSSSFDLLVFKLQGHYTFYNNFYNTQIPSDYQLLITFYHLEYYKNTASIKITVD
ncbi:hypothetical protein C7212DRAFT_196843, partial [Tuber magnatum]